MKFRFLMPDFRLARSAAARVLIPVPRSRIKNQNSKIRRRGKAAGFTLMEVLVALAIFALVAVVLGSSYLNVLNSYEAVARAVQVSEDFAYVRQLVMTEPDRTKLENGGDFDTTGGRRAHWEVLIESTNLADVFKVTLTSEITDPARPQPDQLSQVFTLLRPTWSIDAAERSKLKEDTKTRILELQGKLAK